MIIEEKYKIEGWLKHLLKGKRPIELTAKNFTEELLKVAEEIEKIKTSDYH